MKEKLKKRLSMAVAVLTLAAAWTAPVYGEEAAPKQVITNIYHQHMGNAINGGGCYGEEIRHTHLGDEENGGECYQAVVCHVHEGNSSAQDGCYQTPIYHTHLGDEVNGGACYKEKYHSHEDACMKKEQCEMRYTKGEVLETFTSTCLGHGETTYERASGTTTHLSCGLGEEEVRFEYCKSCGMHRNGFHNYYVPDCGLEDGEAVGYELDCGMTEDDITGYETSCGKEENSVERYVCSCTKTVDGYNRNCGLDENVPVGRLIVTNETAGKEKEANVSVRIEDLTGGKLILEENAFIWYDKGGNRIGQGESITVDKNGDYVVKAQLKNEDVKKDGLQSEIRVDNILADEEEKTGSAGTPVPEPTSQPDDKKKTDNEKEPQASTEPAELIEPVETPLPTMTILPTITPLGENKALPTKKPRNQTKEAELYDQEETAKSSSSKKEEEGVTVPSPILQKNTEKKELPKLAASPETVEIQSKTATGKDSGFFSDPAVRMISITLGGALFLTGAALLFWYFRRHIRVFNDDGEGKLRYIGSCLVRIEEEGYAITITDKMFEEAYTNRFVLRPGILLSCRREGEVLLVYGKKERIGMELTKEMVVVFQ